MKQFRMTLNTLLITPYMAERWLRTNRCNRHLSKHKIDQYAFDMKTGRWQLSSQGIVFDEHGNLLDGQHRLYAIIKADCSVKMCVIQNAPAASKFVIDIGIKRSGADALEMSGIENAAKMAAAINMLAVLLNNATAKPLLPNDLIQCVAKDLAEELQDAVGVIKSFCKQGGISYKSMYPTIYICCCRVFGKLWTNKVFEKILAGFGLEPNTKHTYVRRNIIQKPYNPGTQYKPNKKTEMTLVARGIIGIFTVNSNSAMLACIQNFRNTFTADQLKILDYKTGKMEINP